MFKKVVALALALGCVLSVAAFTVACSDGSGDSSSQSSSSSQEQNGSNGEPSDGKEWSGDHKM